jgi:hypothetical protein
MLSLPVRGSLPLLLLWRVFEIGMQHLQKARGTRAAPDAQLVG